MLCKKNSRIIKFKASRMPLKPIVQVSAQFDPAQEKTAALRQLSDLTGTKSAD